MKKLIKDRHDYIMEICNNKTVLHLGCIGNSYKSKSQYEPWLHKEICTVAKECIGLDLDKERIPLAEKLSKSKIYYGSVTDFNLRRYFDIIVAGEIIEHIDNLHGFFQSIKKHMKSNTKLIITTPNVFNISNIARVLFIGKVYPDPDHVVFFDLHTLTQLLKREGFKVEKYYYNTEIAPQRIRNKFVRFLGLIVPILNLNLMVVATLKKS